MDPRLQARRIEVMRAHGRRRLRLVGISVAMGVVGALAWALVQSPALDLDHVRVQPLSAVKPLSHVDATMAVKSSGLRLGTPLFNRDLGEAERRVERMPWVDQAEVERRWPGTVVISLTERVAIGAVAAQPQGWMLVDRDGRGLEVVAQVPAGIVTIEGVKSIGSAGQVLGSDGSDALGLVEAFPLDLKSHVKVVKRGEDGTLSASLEPRDGAPLLEVRFGLPVKLSLKVVDLVALLAQAPIDGAKVLDVRVPGSPAVVRPQ